MYVSKVWLTVGSNVRDVDDDGGNGNGGREQRRRYIVDGSWSSERDEIANGRFDGRTVLGWFKMNLEWGFALSIIQHNAIVEGFELRRNSLQTEHTENYSRCGLLSPSKRSSSFHSTVFSEIFEVIDQRLEKKITFSDKLFTDERTIEWLSFGGNGRSSASLVCSSDWKWSANCATAIRWRQKSIAETKTKCARKKRENKKTKPSKASSERCSFTLATRISHVFAYAVDLRLLYEYDFE